MPHSKMVITALDGGRVTVRFEGGGARTVDDPAGYQTDIQYVNGQQMLSQIDFPTGLISRLKCINIQYRELYDKLGYVSAVQDCYGREKYTSYRYCIRSAGQTYTGASIGYKMGELRENLREGSGGTSNDL